MRAKNVGGPARAQGTRVGAGQARGGGDDARIARWPVRCRCCPDGISRSTRTPRYPSDMSDAEWAVTEPTLPEPAWKQGRGGRPAQRCRRDTVDAIRYLVREGIRWRAMPADFPHWRSVYDALDGWGKSGATEAMHDELRRTCRIAAGREPEPTAAVIDSQSVRAAETVAAASRGFDAGKKVQGRKRHIAVDTIGLLLTVLITAAGLQDRDAAKPLLWNLKKAFPAVRLAWADGGYAGKLVSWAKTALKLTLQIVRRPDDLHTFQVLPRRWVVERTLAWITPVPAHCPRLRAPDRAPRDHRLLVHDHHHDPPPRPALPACPRVSTAAGPARHCLAGSLPGMTNAHEVVAAYWAAAEARDWKAFGALLAGDVIYRGPQTREQVSGRDPYIRFNVEGFPYDWHITVQQIVAEGQHAASWIEFTGQQGTQPGLCFFELDKDGKIALITDFWPEPYELPASRAHLVERY